MLFILEIFHPQHPSDKTVLRVSDTHCFYSHGYVSAQQQRNAACLPTKTLSGLTPPGRPFKGVAFWNADATHSSSEPPVPVGFPKNNLYPYFHGLQKHIYVTQIVEFPYRLPYFVYTQNVIIISLNVLCVSPDQTHQWVFYVGPASVLTCLQIAVHQKECS